MEIYILIYTLIHTYVSEKNKGKQCQEIGPAGKNQLGSYAAY